MKLSFDTIKAVTVGALTVSEQQDGVHFAKCTQKQLEAWLAFSPWLHTNAVATTGVRLDLHTNSTTFKFSSPNGIKFEIYVNGVLKHYISASDLTDRGFSVELDGADNRITLILDSHSVATVLSSVEIDDGATVSPHIFDKKLLFIGDSITQGWESGYDSLSYAYRVSRFFNADSVIQGIGGGFFHESVFDENIEYDADAVIVAFGTNDWSRSPSLEYILNNMNAFVNKVTRRYEGKPIICLSPIWRDVSGAPQKPAGPFDAYCDILMDAMAKHGVTVIDGRTLTPHLHEFYSDKVLHPNALGFGVYAENLIQAIKDLI